MNMTLAACQAILAMGIFFIVLGVTFLLWNRKELKTYYTSKSTQRDLKEFLTHEPERTWLNAWQIGGRVALLLGILLALTGGVLWLVLYT
jgi:hypothetical protein